MKEKQRKISKRRARKRRVASVQQREGMRAACAGMLQPAMVIDIHCSKSRHNKTKCRGRSSAVGRERLKVASGQDETRRVAVRSDLNMYQVFLCLVAGWHTTSTCCWTSSTAKIPRNFFFDDAIKYPRFYSQSNTCFK